MSILPYRPLEPIMVGGVRVEVKPHAPDWFPLHISDGRLNITLYLKRSELRALLDRLDEIDKAMPEPEER